MEDLLAKLAAGGGGAGWILAAYCLWRMQQMYDKRADADLKLAKVLSGIKTILEVKLGAKMSEDE